MNKEVVKLLSFLFAFAVIFLAKMAFSFFATSAKIHTTNMMHAGWDQAKPDLRKAFEKEVEKSAPELDAEFKTKYLDCVTDKAVVYLNNTTCSYLYNKATTTQEEHLRAQDECIGASGYAQEVEKIAEKCADEMVKMAALQ
jgi:hypothetical protein